MRLRTELYPNRRGSMTLSFDDESLRHDAYAAQALVMAMTETEPAYRAWNKILKDRADELMKDWGYDET